MTEPTWDSPGAELEESDELTREEFIERFPQFADDEALTSSYPSADERPA